MRALIADDHDLIRVAIAKELGNIPNISAVLEAKNAENVIVTLNQNTDIKLLILDLYMPGSNGFELLKMVIEKFPDIDVIVLSATENKQKMRTIIDLGANGFIPKSAPYNVMLNAIDLVLSGGIYIPQNLFVNDSHDSGINEELDFNSNQKVEYSQLTKRQNEVLQCLGHGKSNKEIARILSLSENTVKIHISTILKTLNVSNRTQAGILARQNNEPE